MENLLRICGYCRKETEFWETVSQIPEWVCPQAFLLHQIQVISGALIGNTYICTEHEDSFNLKHVSFKRGNSFKSQYYYVKEKCCKRCFTEDGSSYFIGVASMSSQLQDFVVNSLNESGPST